jgi:hypothetical protein
MTGGDVSVSGALAALAGAVDGLSNLNYNERLAALVEDDVALMAATVVKANRLKALYAWYGGGGVCAFNKIASLLVLMQNADDVPLHHSINRTMTPQAGALWRRRVGG